MDGLSGTESGRIAGRLALVRGRIAAAARRTGRDPAGVTLVAVSKTVPAAAVREAAAAGQLVFGENRVQEAREKIAAAGPGLRWHLIGHLQRNKAKAAAGLFACVESVDSADLARELDRHAAALGVRLRVLVQVRLGAEEGKRGVDPAEAPALIETVAGLSALELSGVMAIPPPPVVPEDSRPFFARLRALRDAWEGSCCPRRALPELSMGMSMDFEVAVEEGATIVRVGTALFGERDRPPQGRC
jgi:pyridoxal phosphate enzyme (YggS family)